MSTPLQAITQLQHTASSVDKPASQQATGQFRGENVKLEVNTKSMLASAAEEMSFMRAEKKTLDVSKRKINDKTSIDLNAIEKAQDYLEKANDVNKDKHLKPLLDQLLRQTDTSPRQLQQNIQQAFKDPSQQYVALLYIKAELEKKKRRSPLSSHEESLLSATETLLDEMASSQASAIAAGINITTVASSNASDKLGSINGLRQFYRDSVLDYGGLSATFKTIIEEHGEESIAGSIMFLIKALGADISSEGPSIPKARLQMIVDDMYKLQSLGSIHNECTELLQQIQRIYAHVDTPTNVTLMDKLLELVEKKWVNGIKISQMAQQLLSNASDVEPYFLRGMKEIIRAIPIKTFADPFDRDKLILSVQEALDIVIDAEESRLENSNP